MKFKVLDIVLSAPGYKPEAFVITDIDLSRPVNQYTGVSLRNNKTYRLSDKSLADKRIGVADPDWNKVGLVTTATATDGNAQTGSVDRAFADGQRRAQKEVSLLQFGGNPDDLKRWELLANAKPDQPIQARVRGKLQTLKLKYVNTGGYKYVFVAENENGTRYKFPLNVIVI